jgi:RNA polymerase sigma-70 factor (ECF subfamily)
MMNVVDEPEVPRASTPGLTDTDLATAFTDHFNEIRRYGYRRVGPEAGEELASETFARAVQRRNTFEPSRCSLRGWLFGIAANVAHEHDRASHRRRAAISRIPLVATRSTRLLEDHVTDTQLVAAALQELRPGLRDVILLVDGLDLSYDDAASALGIPVGTVRSRLSAARARLEEVLSRRGRQDRFERTVSDER